MTTSRVHITPHMHWDREWYFTTEESRILLVNNMEEILERLESDPEYKYYVLDGQTAVLEDYLAIKPENKERMKALVEAGKLIIGPWYSQTDTMGVAGESILRNLLYGMRDCLAFGEPMKIGYLPDSFGMSSQMPQIYNNFGIDTTMFWRGCSERHGTDKTEFVWQSNDGSEVLAQVLPLGYAIGKYLPNDADALKKRLDTYFKVLENASVTKDILLPNGHDQMPLQKDIFEVMDTLRAAYPDREFLMTRYEDVFKRVEEVRDQLAAIKGEFQDAKYMRVHRTIASTRMDIKIAHAQIENKIVNILEPLASIAWSLGFEYHHGLLEKMWKEILKNHAHDSIGGCNSDKVNQEIMNRFVLADDMAENLIRFYMRKIVDHMPATEGTDKLALFNLAPYARTEVVNTTIRIRASKFSLTDIDGQPASYFIRGAREIDPGLVDRQIVHYGNYEPFMEYDIQIAHEIPAMGYTTLYIKGGEAGLIADVPTEDSARVLENSFYKITVNGNGTLTILDKEANQTFDQVLQLEDCSDDGDEYDWSPLRDDWRLFSDEKAAISITREAYQSSANIRFRMAVPANLEERVSELCNGYIDVDCTVTLKNDDRRIDVNMNVDNQADDHRVRVFIPTPYASETCVADNQFGCITRGVSDEAMAVWEEEKWKEAPIPVWQLINFAALENGSEGMAVFTNGLREFEIIDRTDPEGSTLRTSGKKETIALTLFRSIGFLGKEEMFLRPGRPSGIKVPTPDAQVRGKQHYNFAMYGYKGNHITANVMQHARDYNTPIQCYNKIPYNAMKLNVAEQNMPAAYSLFCKPVEGAVLSAVKKAEDDNALIVRFYNASETDEISNDTITFNKPVTEWQEVRMDETPVAEQGKAKGEMGSFRCTQARTFKARF